MNTTDLIDSVTVTNGNSIKDTIVTVIALIPVIPGGVIMAVKYLKNLHISRNKYYSFNAHARCIKALYGVEIIRR